MSSIPPGLARVPNLLSSQLMLSSLTRSTSLLLDMQAKLASGRRIQIPSDDAVGASAVTVLDDVLERREQRLRNLSHAEGVLNNIDAALGDLGNILIEAKGVASSQIGVGSEAETRKSQATVIDAMLRQTINISNRRFQQLQLFGGDVTKGSPIVELKTGLRYTGEGNGLETDLGLSRTLPITVSGEQAFGALSSRVQGNRDLDPILLPSTRLADLNGARGLGVSLGSINVRVNATDVTVDLSNAHTMQDVLTALDTAIESVSGAGTATVVIDPVSQNRIQVTSTVDPVVISDQSVDATAADLGIAMSVPVGVPTNGQDVDRRITDETLVSSLTLPAPLGTIRLGNIGQSRDLDLSGAVTVQDIRNLVEGLDIGIRVEISSAGDRLNFINELSGGDMSIAEVAGGATATNLGVRSFTTDTLLADFNDGLGVQIRSGSVDPVTGLPDPAKDLDFRVTIKDARTFDVDLAGATTVVDVLTKINAAATAAGIAVPGEFNATLAADGNGIELIDGTGGGGPLSVTRLNGSFAGQDLGIIGSTTGATLTGTDRAKVAVDSLFTHLMALRDALLTNDERGITLAGEKLEDDISRATATRADVGARARRVTDATTREEDLRLQDRALRSQIADLDFTEAALRFSALEQQLQAGLATAGRISTLSLLDFLR